MGVIPVSDTMRLASTATGACDVTDDEYIRASEVEDATASRYETRAIAMDIDFRTRMAATVAVLGALSVDESLVALGKSTHQPQNLYRGRICGRDNGKPEIRTQPRNSPCVCGSGRKAKKCCVVFPSEG